MRVIIANPGEDARIEEIGTELEDLQKVVGGYISEIVFSRSVCGFVHDEGLLIGLPWNRQIGPQTYIAGPIVVVGVDEEGESRSLTDTEAKQVLTTLNRSSKRLDHTKASSVEEWEQLTSRPAVAITFGGTTEEIWADGHRVIRRG